MLLKRMTISSDLIKLGKTIKQRGKKIIEEVIGRIKQLPHNCRSFAAPIAWPIISGGFFLLFIINLLLPANQAEEVRKVFLHQPDYFPNKMAMTRILISLNYCDQAKLELAKTNPTFLPQEQRDTWQNLYLSWIESSPEGQRILARAWEKFLNLYPDYKVGWLYLGYYQYKLGQTDSGQRSFQIARQIDPSQEDLIKKIIDSHRASSEGQQ